MLPIRSTGPARSRRAFSMDELLWVLLIIMLLIAVLLPSLSRARELAKRAVCSANLRGMGMGMHIYGNDNAESLPIETHTPYKDPGDELHAVNFVGRLSVNMTKSVTQAPELLTNQHPSRSLFLLVVYGASTPRQFICPSSGDSEDSLRNRIGGGTEQAAQPGINRFDFKGYNTLSYGYQIPFGRKGKPRQGMDARMPVAADKGPCFAAAERKDDDTQPDRASGVLPPASFGTADQVLRTDANKWRPYNSRNHNGEGQNLLFIDDAVRFEKKPIGGVNSDNIYTQADPDWNFMSTLIGRAPEDQRGPRMDTDSVIVP